MLRSLLAAALVVACASRALAASADEFGFTTNIDHAKTSIDCSSLHMDFYRNHRGESGVVTVRRDKTVAVNAPIDAALAVMASDRGGIRVQPSADGSCSAVVCMAAGATTSEEGEKLLDQLTIEQTNRSLSVNGPEGEPWAAYIILSVPKGVALDLSAQNGDLGIRDVSGRFALHTVNGPIAVTNVLGEVRGDAVNGPIHFRGHAGDVQLRAQNGPIGVDLDDATWSGKGLDASTQNGPVELEAPIGLRTGVRVTGSDHSPVRWSGPNGSPEESALGQRVFRLGADPVLIRLSTVNGPVEVKGPATRKHGGRVI